MLPRPVGVSQKIPLTIPEGRGTLFLRPNRANNSYSVEHPNVTILTLQKIAQALDKRLVVELR